MSFDPAKLIAAAKAASQAKPVPIKLAGIGDAFKRKLTVADIEAAGSVRERMEKAGKLNQQMNIAIGLAQAICGPEGQPVAIGGKTGTGDNRLNSYNARGVLTGSRVINRTATFVFFLGDRHFGTITAYVPGPAAENFRFTSALPVQIVRLMAPLLQPVLHPEPGSACQSGDLFDGSSAGPRRPTAPAATGSRNAGPPGLPPPSTGRPVAQVSAAGQR